MSSVLDQVNEKYSDKIKTEKVNLNEHPEIATQYKVRYVPHLLFIDADEKVFKEKVGFMSLEDVVNTFREAGVSIP